MPVEVSLTSKIRIKMGAIEVEYEGSESFLKEELPDLLAAVSKLYQESGGLSETTGADALGGKSDGNGHNPRPTGTTTTLAAKLKVASGTELIEAAAARLNFNAGKETFTRKDLLSEMKSATGFYKKSYVNNFSNYIQTLIKEDKFVEESAGKYALTAKRAAELRQKLA